MLDRDYRIVARNYGLPVNRKKGDDISKFPIEKARFRSTFYPLGLACCALAAYGWCVQRRVHLAVVLILQLLLGITFQICFTTLSTLLMDLDPEAAATAQAVSNLFGCLLAAGGLAALDPLLSGLGAGITFTLAAALAALCAPIFLMERSRGQKWRQGRLQTRGSRVARSQQSSVR